MSIHRLVKEWQDLSPIQWSQNKYGWVLENGKPITLSPWQVAAIDEFWQRRQEVDTLFLSTVKKVGKTTINALLTCYRWLTVPGVHFVVGNDKSQADELQINIISAMVKRHPILRRYSKVTRDTLTFTPTDSRVVSLPMDAPGAAGANFATVSFSELWGYRYEEGQRLFEELTPIPGDCKRIIDSYAGFEGESELLQRIWDRSLSGNRVNDQWPIYRQGKMLAYVHQGQDAQKRCWLGSEKERESYYKEQSETLRPGTYNRLHLNEWAASEDVFITAEQWDALIISGYRCPSPSKSVKLHIACDIGVKRDHCAVVSVFRDDKELWLGPYRVWKPSKGKEVDLSAVEQYLIELWQGYHVITLAGDPSQFLYLKQRLQKVNIPVTEFIQSTARLTEAGNTLFDVIRQGRLRVYPGAKELKQYVLNARAKETERGIRLVKDTNSKKIDAAIALAMAVTEAEQKGYSPPAYGEIIDIPLDVYRADVSYLYDRTRLWR